MRKAGLIEDQIDSECYYNANLYKGFVDRFMFLPKHLYWCVRSVFVMYGDLEDNKDKKLFNNESWTSTNNILKERLQSYYSGPPRVQLYTKCLNSDKSVKKNEYGMEMIDCLRGTNRVEACH